MMTQMIRMTKMTRMTWMTQITHSNEAIKLYAKEKLEATFNIAKALFNW